MSECQTFITCWPCYTTIHDCLASSFDAYGLKKMIIIHGRLRKYAQRYVCGLHSKGQRCHMRVTMQLLHYNCR